VDGLYVVQVMKTLIALLAITISSALAAPKKWPDVPYTHVVGYCYDFSQDARGASISFPDGSLHKGVIKATTVRLSDAQTENLLKILNDDVEHERGESECYDPHHAFVFYDSNWKIVASIDICFLCDGHTARPKGAPELFDLQAMAAFCRQIGLPWHEESEEYTKLFRQEQPTKEPQAKEQKKQKEIDNADPFDPAK
jgi:hypothetical protein